MARPDIPPSSSSGGRPLGPEEVRRLQTAHEAAVAALEAAVRDTTRLTRLFMILSEPAPLPVLLDRVLSTLSELFSSDVVVLLQRGEGGDFLPLAGIGIPEDRAQLPVPAAEGSLPGAALRTRSPVSAEGGRVPAELADLGVQSAVWLPVLGDHGVAAVLLLARCQLHAFTPAEVGLLTVMAHRIAVVLEGARADALLREAQDRLLQTEKLALAGKLAGSMAHELNNPLACVRANLEQLRGRLAGVAGLFGAALSAARFLELQPGAAAQEHARALRSFLDGENEPVAELHEVLADSLEAASRMSRLVATFTRLATADRPVEPQRTEVRAVIAECVADLPADTGRPGLVHELAHGPPCVAWISPSVLKVGLTGVLRMLLSPGLRRVDPARSVVIRAERHDGRPTVVVSDPGLLLSEDERRAIFDPRLEVVDTPAGRTVRLSLLAALSYQLLRGCGAEVTTAVHGAQGATIRILLPPPPGAGAGG